MQNHFRRYCSILFLLLLSFPMVEKSIHTWGHHDEIACTITDKHFHEQEHSCSVCDFTINDSNGLPSTELSFLNSSQTFYFSAFPESAELVLSFSNLPSRAPPLV